MLGYIFEGLKVSLLAGYHTITNETYFNENPLVVVDVDECANGTHHCDVNAVCNNIRGSYNCTCKDGFYGDGINCTGNYITLLKVSKYILT